MEIEIDSKRNNPLLKRTEIYFTLKHTGEGTPNREIIRSELAEKLNVKKENIIINTVHSSFGIQEITGYAKIYSSLEKSKEIEPDYILIRNKLMDAKEKGKKKAEAKKPAGEPKKEVIEEKPAKQKPAEEPAKKPETAEKPQKVEIAGESIKKEEKPAEKTTVKQTEKPKGNPGSESEHHTKEKKE
jgi:small subunit ribosomal protein S24e